LILFLGISLALADSGAMFLPPDVSARVLELRHQPLGDRVKAHSDPWLGAPYTDGPLGEAGGPDPDPVFRYDTFDCLTFVEEVLALSLAADPVGVQAIRMGLRYRGGQPADYENRRHFMLAEWIPGTVEEGWMWDLTAQLPGAVEYSRTVRNETWRNWSRRSLFDLEDDRLPVGEQRFWYLPLDAAAAAVNRIPPGTVVFTLRQPMDHIPISVTHVGITIPGEEVTMRHATKMGEGSLRDDSLAWYIEHLRSYSNWPVVGLIVLAPREQGPRPNPPPVETRTP